MPAARKVDKLLNQEELITSAYHEAGHAVIAWYYGRRILGVFISRDKNKNSNCEIIRLFGKISDIEIHELEREMDISMAGIVATERLAGKKVAGMEWLGTDYPDAVNIAKDWALKTGKALNNECLIDHSIDVDGIKGCIFSGAFLDDFGGNVRNLMSRPRIWRCVKAVAYALLKNNELGGDEVSSIISKAWEDVGYGRQEELVETQSSDNEIRPWGEWR